MKPGNFSCHIFLLILTSCSLAMSSCGTKDTVWTKSAGLPCSTWDRENKLVFVPDSDKLEKGSPKRLVLFVKYKENANLSTLPLIIETESSVAGHEYSLDSVYMELFDKNGKPKGNGSYGMYEKSDTFNLLYPVVEGWSLTANPAVSTEKAEGIIAFGISLLK